MMKISIKREQSQAGLSFAEREKFRPQVKNKLLLLLALLLTAATGAWAEDPKVYDSGEVELYSLQEGDILMPGVTLTNKGNKDVEPFLNSNRFSIDGVKRTIASRISSIPFSIGVNGLINAQLSGTGPNMNSMPITEDGKTGNAWVVTRIYTVSYRPGYKEIDIAGTTYPEPKHLITATYREQTRSLEQPLPYATTIGELYESVSGKSFSDLISDMSLVDMTLTGISSNNTSAVSIGELNGASTPVTVIADGKATISINFGSYAYGIFVSAISPLYANMKSGVKDADKWTVKVGEGQAQALPIGGLKGDGSETVTLQYNGRLKVKGVKATSDAAPAAGKTVDLSTLTADYEAQNGDVLTGVTASHKVTIAAGATVTLDGVTISRSSYCIKCAGDATIILKDGSTNTLTSTSNDYPALWIGDANTTLTIQGSTGVLNVTSGENSAGIGGGYSNTNQACGNIRIEGGVITAQGGGFAAGIGTDCGPATCGDIIITGGTITANGGGTAAGIGTGNSNAHQAVCGAITIANTVTKVTATKGSGAPHSIGKGGGGNASCGTVTIGGTKYWENNAAVGDGATYLATSPLIYEPSN